MKVGDLVRHGGFKNWRKHPRLVGVVTKINHKTETLKMVNLFGETAWACAKGYEVINEGR